MTNEQAIMKLKHLQFDPTTDEFDEEALNMAIEALQSGVLRNYEPILTEEERAEVLNAIIDALPSYQVDGYADNNGIFFDVFISKAERRTDE